MNKLGMHPLEYYLSTKRNTTATWNNMDESQK